MPIGCILISNHLPNYLEFLIKVFFINLCGGSVEIFRVWLFYIGFGRQVIKTRNLEEELQALAYFSAELSINCMNNYQIYKNIYNTEVNGTFF